MQEEALPIPANCCCPQGARANQAGYIVINAGCKIHGIRTEIDYRSHSITGKDVLSPAAPRRTGGGMFHRIAE